MDMVRDLPYNLEAEAAVLGSVIIDKECLLEVMEFISANDFYVPKNQEIYKAITNLFNLNIPVDVVTLYDELIRMGIYEQVGGKEYILDIVNSVPTTENVKHYAKIVADQAHLRKLITLCQDIENEGYASKGAQEVTEYAISKIFDLVSERDTGGITHIKPIIYQNYNKFAEMLENRGQVAGIPTGFSELDRRLSGLKPSTLVLIAARPAMGKTSFAINIAQNVAITQNLPVLIFSLEMSKEELVNRIISSEARIESDKIRSGEITPEDMNKFLDVMEPLSKAPIYIDDNASATVTDIRAKAKRMKLEKGLGLIVIDYLQLMQSGRRAESRQVEIAAISRDLKVLAKDLEVPVIAVSQLSRGPENRADNKPMLSDLRESGAIEQDADIVMFLFREEYYKPETTEKHNIGECIIAKHRAGETGSFEMTWLGKYTSFYDLETRHEPY
ncbi:MAG: replicative DNA helicase [Ruminococcaceae bacterium]|nr:replicative DNA helicase [Oscillospiraceae bacterium]